MAKCRRCVIGCDSEPACGVIDPVAGDKYPWHALYMSILPVEQVPLYHVCPGGVAARLVAPVPPWRCSYCSWAPYSDPGSLVLRRFGEGEAKRLLLLQPDVFLLDGGEPLALDWALELPSMLRRVLGDKAPEYYGARTAGLVSLERLRAAKEKGYSFIVFEHLAAVETPPRLDHVYEALREAYRLFPVVEIHVAYDGSKKADMMVSELVDRYPEAAVHVVPVKGGEEVADKGYSLVEKLRDKGKHYVYLYGDESYTLTDTLCRSCGKPLVSRKPWGIRIQAERGSEGMARCMNCGAEHPWIRLCREKPRRHRALHRETVVW
ncbi:hypothetical protein PYJP_12850 [Pyrofollis japonicus]|uniref:hypothetical protein n=1 Tax=Pyrofollis japonicus TaxID=3060460 RepID=UPI00295A8955|nr:hypothetical protein [Pyrofollis japonicus]BEP17933.1 hypothetical protein PYJP_12850 [Pyrofollis japonicus]